MATLPWPPGTHTAPDKSLLVGKAGAGTSSPAASTQPWMLGVNFCNARVCFGEALWPHAPVSQPQLSICKAGMTFVRPT